MPPAGKAAGAILFAVLVVAIAFMIVPNLLTTPPGRRRASPPRE